MIVHSLSSHRKGNQVSNHPSIHLQTVLSGEGRDDIFDSGEGNKGHLFSVALLDLFLDVLPVSADQVHELFILLGVPEQRNRLLSNWQAFFFIKIFL